jgi:hypothetical protein
MAASSSLTGDITCVVILALRRLYLLPLLSLSLRIAIRTCIHNRGMLDGRVFFSSDKEIFRSNPDGLQGKATQYGGKKTGQTASNGCEYRF